MKNYILLLCMLTTSILFAQTTDVVTNINFPGGVLTNNTDLYVSDWQSGIVYKYDLSAPPADRVPTLVANGLTRTYGLFLNGNDLYFSDTNTNIVYKIDITDPNAQKEIVLENLDGPYNVFIHNDIMYVANNSGDTITKFDLSNPSAVAETIVTGINGPFDLKVINNYLYFTQRADNKLSKVSLDNPGTVIDILTNLSAPSGLAIKDNTLYIAEPYIVESGSYLPGRISKIDTNEPNPTTSLIYQYPDGSTWSAYGQHLFVGSDDLLYVGESYGNKVVSLDLNYFLRNFLVIVFVLL